MSFDKKKNTSMPKQIKRNVEIPLLRRNRPPLKPNDRNYYFGQYVFPQKEEEQNMLKSEDKRFKNEKNKLKIPQYNTLIGQAQEINFIQNVRIQPLKSTADLTPRSKATLAPRITQKMNFYPTQKIYKNLIPININDSLLLPKQTTLWNKLSKTSNKIVMPELCDFLQPITPLVHCIPEPEINQQFPQNENDAYGYYTNLYESKITL